MVQLNTFKSTDLSIDDRRRKKTEVLIKALMFLRSEWGWSTNKLSEVLNIPQTTISKWIKDGHIPKEVNSPDVSAIVSLISIHKSLYSIFSNASDQIKWLETKHPAFKKSPLEVMSHDASNLMRVRSYLDYVRGRGA